MFATVWPIVWFPLIAHNLRAPGSDMSLYLILKWIHILSATVLLGTGAGIALKETRMSTTPQTGVGVIQEVCREIFSCSHPRRLAVRPNGRVVFLKIAPCSW